MQTQKGGYCSCTTAPLILLPINTEHILRIKGFPGPISTWQRECTKAFGKSLNICGTSFSSAKRQQYLPITQSSCMVWIGLCSENTMYYNLR